MASSQCSKVLLILLSTRYVYTSGEQKNTSGKTGTDSRVDAPSGVRGIIHIFNLLETRRKKAPVLDVAAPSPMISTFSPLFPSTTIHMTTPLPVTEPIKTEIWRSPPLFCSLIILILAAMLVVGLLLWFRHYRSSKLPIMEPECNYSYVEVQRLPISQLRTLISTNSRLQEQSFIPSLPVRPNHLIYDQPYV